MVIFRNVLSDGNFKSKTKLIIMFDELNIGDKPFIFSFGSGLTACIILLARELVMEYQKSVYDSSWTEWTENGNWRIVWKK